MTTDTGDFPTPLVHLVQADSTNQRFDFAFPVQDSNDVRVGLERAELSDESFTVYLDSETDGGYIVLHLVPEVGQLVTIWRETTPVNQTDFQEGASLKAATLNGAFDQMILTQQETRRDLSRGLRQSMMEEPLNMDLPSVAERASMLLGFDSAGQPIPFDAESFNAMLETAYRAEAAAESAETAAAEAEALSQSLIQKIDALNEPLTASGNLKELTDIEAARRNLGIQSQNESAALQRQTTQALNAAALLSFKLAISEGFSLMDLGEGVSDDFQDLEGISPHRPLAYVNPATIQGRVYQPEDSGILPEDYQDHPDLCDPSLRTVHALAALPYEFSITFTDSFSLHYIRLHGLTRTDLLWRVEALSEAGEATVLIDQKTIATSNVAFSRDYICPASDPVTRLRFLFEQSGETTELDPDNLFELMGIDFIPHLDETKSGDQGDSLGVGLIGPRNALSFSQMEEFSCQDKVYFSNFASFFNGYEIEEHYISGGPNSYAYEAATGHGDFTATFVLNGSTETFTTAFGFAEDHSSVDTSDTNHANLGSSSSKNFGFGGVSSSTFKVYEKGVTTSYRWDDYDTDEIYPNTFTLQRRQGQWKLWLNSHLVHSYNTIGEAGLDNLSRYFLIGRQMQRTTRSVNLYFERERMEYYSPDPETITLTATGTGQSGDVTTLTTNSMEMKWSVRLAYDNLVSFEYPEPMAMRRFWLNAGSSESPIDLKYSDDGENWTTAASHYYNGRENIYQYITYEWPDCGRHKFWGFSMVDKNASSTYWQFFQYAMFQPVACQSGDICQVRSRAGNQMYETATAPNMARLLALYEGPEPTTDLSVALSRDDGANWVEAPLEDLGSSGTDQRILAAEANFDLVPEGTRLRWSVAGTASEKPALEELTADPALFHNICLQWG